MNVLKSIIITVFLFAGCFASMAQNSDFTAATASAHETDAAKAMDGNVKTGWKLTSKDLKSDQYLQLALKTPGDLTEVHLQIEGTSAIELEKIGEAFCDVRPNEPWGTFEF